MAQLAPPEDITALETVRTRLARLDHALDSLRRDLLVAEPPGLPPWPQLQASLSRVAEQLRNASTTLTADADFLSSAISYPLPSFPGLEMFGVVETLFRSKTGDGAEEWATQASQLASSLEDDESGNRMSPAQMNELWLWADTHNDETVEDIDFDVDLTADESNQGLDASSFGLRKKLRAVGYEDDEEDEDAEKEQQKDADNLKAPSARIAIRPLEDIMRYMSTGTQPRSAISRPLG